MSKMLKMIWMQAFSIFLVDFFDKRLTCPDELRKKALEDIMDLGMDRGDNVVQFSCAVPT